MAMATESDLEPLPQQGEILSLAAMVSDAQFFLKRKLKRPKQTGRWNATAIGEDVTGEKILPTVEAPVTRKGGKGKIKSAKSDNIPPSVKKTYKPLV